MSSSPKLEQAILEALKKRLDEHHRELMREMRSLGNTVGEGIPLDHEEGTSAREAMEILGSTESIEIREVRAVEDALLRIEKGTYGVCGDCEKEIPVERLLARPEACSCAPCQRKREAGPAV